MKLVADTSGLLSLAATPAARQTAFPLVLDGYDVAVPEEVVGELEATAEYEDEHATAAHAVLDERSAFEVVPVDLDPVFPLDDGENAAIQLAENVGASFLYCDEYNRLALIHASLSDPQLVTTPRVLKALVVRGKLSNQEAKELLCGISRVRSWEGNAYVSQATRLFK